MNIISVEDPAPTAYCIHPNTMQTFSQKLCIKKLNARHVRKLILW